MLHRPAESGNAAVLETMLACGFETEAKDKDNVTPLHRAAMGGHAEAVRVLLKHGADVNARDGMFSAPPLVWAVEGRSHADAQAAGHVEVARLLIAAGSPLEWTATRGRARTRAHARRTGGAEAGGAVSVAPRPHRSRRRRSGWRDPMNAIATNSGELVGLTVVDLSRYLPGPYCTRLLADMGATVIGRHPHLVHCSIGGYPGGGQAAERSGHDPNYQADAGLLAANPRVPDLPIADITGGLRAAVSITAALVQRARTGHGAILQVSLYDGARAWAPFLVPPRLRGDYACYNVYRTADGSHVALGALEPKFWERFCRRVGREDWIAEQFAEAARARLLDEVAALFAAHGAAHWADALLPLDCCFSVVGSGRA